MPRRSLRSWLWKPSVQEEVDDELAFHLEMRTREFLERGLDADAARRAALRRFGDLRQATLTCQRIGKERDRDMRRREYLSELRQDLTFGVRQLLKARAFAAVAILTLALGIGATAAVFSALYAVVLRPLPMPEGERLVSLRETWNGACCGTTSVGNLVAWHARTTDLFDGVAAWQTSSFNLADGDAPERAAGLRVTGDYFTVMRMPPLLGRTFGPAEDAPGSDRVVVLSHRLFNRRYGGDRGLIGRPIRMNGHPYTVLGVMPAAFELDADVELWVPAAFTSAEKADYDRHFLQLIARLKPGVTITQATARAQIVMAQLRREQPIENTDREGVVQPFSETFVGDYAQRYWVLLGAVGLVLLIACANVANLLMVRGATRATELAIRGAMGAGRGRLVRQLLTESLLLALLGAGAGLALADVAIRAFVLWSPPGAPRLATARLDPATIAFTAAIAIVSALLFGLLPAWRAARPTSVEVLKTGRSGALGARHDRLRGWLVTAEVALVLVLLVGAGLLVRTAIALQQVEPGFNPAGVITGRVTLPPDEYRDPHVVEQSFERLAAEVRGLPGVRAAAISSYVPFSGGGASNGLIPEGRQVDWSNPLKSTVESHLRLVTPGYFETMGIPLARGRDFSEQDRRGTQKVMIVNEAFAARAWPGQEPVGKRVQCCEDGPDGAPDWKIVIGIARTVRWRGLSQEPAPEFYLPLAQVPPAAWDWVQRTVYVTARTTQDPAALAAPIRRVVSGIDASLPLFNVRTMDDRRAQSLATSRFNTMLLLTLGLTGLVLALVGIYGVIAYFVSHRTQEIGVRLALGASPADVVRLVVREGLRPVLWGVAIGVGLALGVTQLLASQLYGVTPRDPLTLAGVAGVLLVIALAASWLPARRATRIDPTRALQST